MSACGQYVTIAKKKKQLKSKFSMCALYNSQNGSQAYIQSKHSVVLK